jgi:hypothetical protein
VTLAAGTGGDGSSPNSSKPVREKISVVAHMNQQERVSFKMYKDDPFQKVRYFPEVCQRGLFSDYGSES